MKVVGIIAEYNPFHNGHAYQIKKAKEITGADYVVVVMSGNYVQRGTPAILDKFSRTSMALQNGADLVFELPVLWSTASAEYFAMAGITLLDKLGIVDYVSFGCETENFRLLESVAKILADEPEEFSALLKDCLKSGLAYPVAREQALLAYLQFPQKNTSLSDTFLNPENGKSELHKILSSPNNILAIEYCKALYKRDSVIKPCPILRTGAGYHETDLHSTFSSASALRKLLLSETSNKHIDLKEILLQNVPADAANCLPASFDAFICEKDFSAMLYYKLFSECPDGFESYGDSSRFLSDRIVKQLDSYLDFEQFCSLLKTKEITHTRIRRLLLHILLNIRQTDYIYGKEADYIRWLRPLGFRKEASCLLGEIKENSCLPIISKLSKANELLSASAYRQFEQELWASNLYYGVLSQKKSSSEKNEFQREIIRL